MNGLNEPVCVVNVGLEGFAKELAGQGAQVVQVDWRPPAQGDPELIDLLSRLYTPEVEAANRETVKRMTESRPVWVDVETAIKAALKLAPEGIDIFKLVSEGIQMGDEVHARSAACTLLLLRRLTPLLLAGDADRATVAKIFDFIAGNNHSFLGLTMAACKTAADAAHGVPRSTVVTAMSRNGVDFALRVGGAGDAWFIAKTAPMDEAIYYSGYGPEDAAGDIGDSAIVETAGLGGMIIGAAPSISSFVGGSTAHARASMAAMQSICAGSNPAFATAATDFTPAPTGIDLRKVVRLGLTPIIDTGVLHKASGVGQIGTGIARAPMDVFVRALKQTRWDEPARSDRPETA